MKSQTKQSQSSNINQNRIASNSNYKSSRNVNDVSKSLVKNNINTSQKKVIINDSCTSSSQSKINNFNSINKSNNKSVKKILDYSREIPKKITFSVKKMTDNFEENDDLTSKFMTEMNEKKRIHNEKVNSIIKQISSFHDEIVFEKNTSNIESLISLLQENDIFTGIFKDSSYIEYLNNLEDEIMIKYPKILNLLIAISKYKISNEINKVELSTKNNKDKNEISTQLSLLIESNPIVKIIADDLESYKTNKVKRSFAKESEISRGFNRENENKINSKVESERDLCCQSVNTLKTDYKIFNNPFKAPLIQNQNNPNNNMTYNLASCGKKVPFDSQSNNTLNTINTIKSIDTGLYKTLNKTKPNMNNCLNSNIAVCNSEMNYKFNRFNNLSHVSDGNENDEEFELTDLSFNKSDSNCKEEKNQVMTETKTVTKKYPISCSVSPLVKPMLSFNPIKIIDNIDNNGKRILETSCNLEDSFIPNEEVDLANLLNKNTPSQENANKSNEKTSNNANDENLDNITSNVVNNRNNTILTSEEPINNEYGNNINLNSNINTFNDIKSQNFSNLDTTRGIASQTIYEDTSLKNSIIKDNNNKENRFDIVNSNHSPLSAIKSKKNNIESKKILESLNYKYNTKTKQESSSFINDNRIDINNLVLYTDPAVSSIVENGSNENKFVNINSNNDNDNENEYNLKKAQTNFKFSNLDNSDIFKARTHYKANFLNLNNSINNGDFNEMKRNRVNINDLDDNFKNQNDNESDINKDSVSNNFNILNQSSIHNKSFCSLNKTLKSDKRKKDSNTHMFEHNPIFDVGYPVLTSNSLAKHKDSIINSLNNSDHKLNSSGLRSRNIVFEEKLMSNSLNGIKEENDAVIEL